MGMEWDEINVDHEDDHRPMMSEKYLERCGPRVHLVQVHSTPTQCPKSSWFGPGVPKFHPKGRATGHHKSHSHTRTKETHTVRSLSLLVFQCVLQSAYFAPGTLVGDLVRSVQRRVQQKLLNSLN